jgi:hypothetical protein
MRRATSRRPLLALAALATLALGACVGDGDELITDIDPTAGPLFDRYVSLGNSITAGFQSGGIVDSLQLRAYPVLLAARAGADFGVPLLARPGCPAPFTAPLTPPTGTPPCALRQDTNVPPVVQNLAVPGARLQDLFTLPTDAGPRTLYTLITGGRSQIRAMIEAEPTFVSVWIGNNDALLAATGGRLGVTADSLLTRLAPFTANVGLLADSIKASGAEGALLIGVVDPVVSVPLLQPGAFFFLARDPATGRFQGKPVNANCSPVTALGQPNPLSANLVSFQILSNAAITEINCDPATAQAGGQFLLDATEIALVRTRVAQFNAAIQAVAAANNWAYVDPNPLFAQLAAQTTTVGGQALFQNVRKCQALATATTPAAIQSAVLRSCPVTGTTAAPNFFGSLFSFDGVHPSTAAHRILAGTFAAAINAKYGTQLSVATT